MFFLYDFDIRVCVVAVIEFFWCFLFCNDQAFLQLAEVVSAPNQLYNRTVSVHKADDN